MIPCPTCGTTMANKPIEVFAGTGHGDIDACPACRLLWFDRFENIGLTPRAVLELFRYIGSVSTERIVPLASRFDCPRRHAALEPTQDLRRTTPFAYGRRVLDPGRLIP